MRQTVVSRYMPIRTAWHDGHPQATECRALSSSLSRPLFLLVRCSAVFTHETHPRVRLHKRTQDTYTPSSRLISACFDRTQAISTGVDSGRCLTPVLCWIIDDYIGVSRDRDRGLLTLTAWNFWLSRNLGTRFCLVYGVARTTIDGEVILTLSRAPSKLAILKSFVRLENRAGKISQYL